MRILGIDYGVKRVGIALSDENKKMSFPYAILPNDKKIYIEIKKICEKETVEEIVLGLPLALNNHDTNATKPAQDFKLRLEKELGLAVIFEKEFYTTKEAERVQGKIKKIDASAAALILKHYFDKRGVK